MYHTWRVRCGLWHVARAGLNAAFLYLYDTVYSETPRSDTRPTILTSILTLYLEASCDLVVPRCCSTVRAALSTVPVDPIRPHQGHFYKGLGPIPRHAHATHQELDRGLLVRLQDHG